MGILPSHLVLLAREQKYHPIRGSVLTLGQQAVWFTKDDAEQMLKSEHIELSALKEGFDVRSKIGRGSALWDGRTNAQTVLSLLGAKEVFACDCSDYENPDFLIDLNEAVDDKYFERFDVILDSGTLEHVFNIPMALRNLNYMLKKGGEIILMSPSSNFVDHGFYSISPTLYFDFFKANSYSNFNCYLIEENTKFISKGIPPERSRIYYYNRVGLENCLSSPYTLCTLFLATKNKDSNSFEITVPFQSLYANQPGWNSDLMAKDGSGRNQGPFILEESVFKKAYHNFIKPFLPKRLKAAIYYFFPLFVRKKCKNLTYIGQINCSLNPMTLNYHIRVRLKNLS